jgi:hypothetical protein
MESEIHYSVHKGLTLDGIKSQLNPLHIHRLRSCTTHFYLDRSHIRPTTVAAPFKAWTVFALSNAVIVGSNPTQGIDACVLLFRVCVILCAGSDLATGWSSVQVALPTVYRIKNLKSGQGSTKGCRAIDCSIDLMSVVCTGTKLLVKLYRKCGKCRRSVTRNNPFYTILPGARNFLVFTESRPSLWPYSLPVRTRGSSLGEK